MSSKAAYMAGRLEGQAARQARDSVKWLARAGYAARGFLYLVIGGLAALAAFGYGGEITDSKGALLQIYAQPFGRVLLLLAALGLFGYAAFLIYRAAFDPEAEAREAWGPIKRAWWLVVGLLHVSLGIFAIGLLTGNSAGASADDTRGLTAELLAWTPLGPWLVAAIGFGLLIGSAYELWCAWSAQLDDQLELTRLRQGPRRWVIRLGRAGIAARGIVGVVAGTFLVVAAMTSNATQAKGFGESLSVLRAMPLGGALFAGVALGLLAFGGYQLVEARYRRVLGSCPS